MIVNKDRDEPLYMISVVARMLRVHPQTLRQYEREGLVAPKRVNKKRLYSEDDVERLGLVIRLTRELGVNRAGADIILRMMRRLEGLKDEMQRMMLCLDEDERERFEQRVKNIFEEE